MTIKITCKICKTRFDRLDWMTKKDCENPNCRCPEVVKLRQTTNDVINKAKESSGNQQRITRTTVPTGYDADTKQYMMDVPDVLVVDILVPYRNQNPRKRK